jgi:hypothetical protein
MLRITLILFTLVSGMVFANNYSSLDGIGLYKFEMSPDDVRKAFPRKTFYERFYDKEKFPQFHGAGTLTMGPPLFIAKRNFAVILNFNFERKLFKIDLVHFDWAKSRSECEVRHASFIKEIANRHGPFLAATAIPGMERVINNEIFGIYIGIKPEDERDAVLTSDVRKLADGSVVQHYRASKEAPDLRKIKSQWGSDEIFYSSWLESDAARARYIDISTAVRPLSLDDEPRKSYQFNCTTHINIVKPSIEWRVN